MVHQGQYAVPAPGAAGGRAGGALAADRKSRTAPRGLRALPFAVSAAFGWAVAGHALEPIPHASGFRGFAQVGMGVSRVEDNMIGGISGIDVTREDDLLALAFRVFYRHPFGLKGWLVGPTFLAIWQDSKIAFYESRAVVGSLNTLYRFYVEDFLHTVAKVEIAS